jgi:hypothetical protein
MIVISCPTIEEVMWIPKTKSMISLFAENPHFWLRDTARRGAWSVFF